ncbi:MAG: hypothetical protein ABL888_18335 [Pirellulaceae bacterium]
MSSFRKTAVCFFAILMLAIVPSQVACGQLGGEQPLRPEDQKLAARITEQVSASEWLGPLAPIALSPYFGITCLAGMAQFGEGTWLEQNHLVSQNPVLKHPGVFWVFLTLTLATSIPRFSKVSKPIAQLLDRVETYSAIITLIVIRLAVSEGAAVPDDAPRIAGVGTLPLELLMIVAAAANIIVISTVRFVFELIVWLSPFPTVDALFEIANKSVCTALMALYAFSPVLALVLNVCLFAICAALFRPMYRRAIYMRSLIVDPVLATIFPSMSQLRDGEMVVFNRERLFSFPAKSRLFLRRSDSGWILRKPNWFLGSTEQTLGMEAGPLVVQKGIIVNRIILKNPEPAQLIFSRRYSSTMAMIAKEMRMSLATEEKTMPAIEPA